jgi:SAM-dependent methyltransferase
MPDQHADQRGYLPDAAAAHYASGYEAERLMGGSSRIELARTQEIVLRYAPPPPAVVYDIGGGPGVYARWLAGLGYTVHLVDALPLHVAQARRDSEQRPGAQLASASVGDARQLPFTDASGDLALLLGPLYHLTERADRLAALREVRRVLRPGGLLFAAAISRFVSTLDGLRQGFLDDPAFVAIAARDVREGQHRNPTNHPGYFTTAYLHHPDELRAEVEDAGLIHAATLAVEGPAWLAQWVLDAWDDPARRERVLAALRMIEAEPSLLGASAHLLTIARTPS